MDLNSVLDVYKKTLSNQWENEELYSYGMRQLKMALLNITTIFVLGFFFHLFFEGIIFSLCYILLRKTAGGFHAKTPVSCYIFSVVLYIGALATVKFCPSSLLIEIGELIIFLLVVRYLPVENENKKLSAMEKKVYKRWAILLFVILFLLGFFLFEIGKSTYYMAVMAAIAGTLLLAVLKLAGSLMIHK